MSVCACACVRTRTCACVSACVRVCVCVCVCVSLNLSLHKFHYIFCYRYPTTQYLLFFLKKNLKLPLNFMSLSKLSKTRMTSLQKEREKRLVGSVAGILRPVQRHGRLKSMAGSGCGGRRVRFVCLFVCWSVAYRPSNMRVYLRDGSAQTNFTCCHTEIEAADQTFHLTQSQYTDPGPTSPSADPRTPGAWQGSHWSANFEVTGMTRSRKNPGASGIRTRDLPLSRRTP